MFKNFEKNFELLRLSKFAINARFFFKCVRNVHKNVSRNLMIICSNFKGANCNTLTHARTFRARMIEGYNNFGFIVSIDFFFASIFYSISRLSSLQRFNENVIYIIQKKRNFYLTLIKDMAVMKNKKKCLLSVFKNYSIYFLIQPYLISKCTYLKPYLSSVSAKVFGTRINCTYK